MTTVHVATTADLDAVVLYGLLRLRVEVFVVEQACAYPELDGRDLEPFTLHLWTADAVGPTAYLRLLDDGKNAQIGRVCTRVESRGTGLAARLVEEALGLCSGREVVLDAQSPLAGWYARFDFEPAGPEFVEDGIAHTPMRRLAR